ncbi:MAG: hypothetical protein HY868_01880 [Chloroflexi bacterium]|nr:hypothetical protein [Chloroflexota bacterium]
MSESSKPHGLVAILVSEFVMGTLITLLSVMTAWSAYQGTLAGSAQADANVEGQKVLSLSNTEFLRTNQHILQDYAMYDGYFTHQKSNADLTEYYQDNFSDELKASVKRPEGPFDDKYYDEMNKEADELYSKAVAKFEEGQQAGERADRYQFVVLIFAVGLAMVAWSSVVRGTSSLRSMFVLISLAALIFGLVNFAALYFGR